MLTSSFLKTSGRDHAGVSVDNCSDKTWLSFGTALFVSRFLG